VTESQKSTSSSTDAVHAGTAHRRPHNTLTLGIAQTATVLDLVRALRDHGLAVLIISHNLNDVFAVADRIAVLYLGRMAAQGPVAGFDRPGVVEYMTAGRTGAVEALIGPPGPAAGG